MAILLKEYLDLNYDKNLVKEALEKRVPIVVKAILQRADAVNQNKRVYPRRILEREVENYKKAVLEGRATGECVPAGTEILTESGWKDIINVRAGEKILTLNLQTDKIEVCSVSEKICMPYKDKMVHIWNNKGSIDMTLTKNHKVLLWDRNDKPYDISAIELYDKIKANDSKISHSYIRKEGIWEGINPEYFELQNSDIKIKLEDWAAFLGIYIAEGHSSGTRGGENKKEVGITQKFGARQDKIKTLLDKLPFKYKLLQDRQFIIKNEALYQHLVQLGNSLEKHIPQYAKNWSPRLLRIMFDWMLMGDGRNRKDRDGITLNEYCTISPTLAKDTLEILVKLGSGGSISSYQPVDREIEGRIILSSNSHRMHIIHESTTKKGAYLGNGFINTELVDFDDYVYCVSVPPNKTWLMRNDVGKGMCWTYNCDHPDSSIVSLENVSHVIRDISWDGNDVVGTLEVLNTPKGKIIQSLMEAGIKIGISSRGVGETVKTNEGFDMVDESFMLVAFDLVSEPSTQNAWLHESKNITVEDIRQMISKNDRVNRIINEILK